MIKDDSYYIDLPITWFDNGKYYKMQKSYAKQGTVNILSKSGDSDFELLGANLSGSEVNKFLKEYGTKVPRQNPVTELYAVRWLPYYGSSIGKEMEEKVWRTNATSKEEAEYLFNREHRGTGAKIKAIELSTDFDYPNNPNYWVIVNGKFLAADGSFTRKVDKAAFYKNEEEAKRAIDFFIPKTGLIENIPADFVHEHIQIIPASKEYKLPNVIEIAPQYVIQFKKPDATWYWNGKIAKRQDNFIIQKMITTEIDEAKLFPTGDLAKFDLDNKLGREFSLYSEAEVVPAPVNNFRAVTDSVYTLADKLLDVIKTNPGINVSEEEIQDAQENLSDLLVIIYDQFIEYIDEDLLKAIEDEYKLATDDPEKYGITDDELAEATELVGLIMKAQYGQNDYVDDYDFDDNDQVSIRLDKGTYTIVAYPENYKVIYSDNQNKAKEILFENLEKVNEFLRKEDKED